MIKKREEKKNHNLVNKFILLYYLDFCYVTLMKN